MLRRGTMPRWFRRPEDRKSGESELTGSAEQSALGLLADILGTSVAELRRREQIDIRSRLFADIVYRLRAREPVEVYDGDGRRLVGRLCVVVLARVPSADELIVKALWLRANEIECLKIAQRVP